MLIAISKKAAYFTVFVKCYFEKSYKKLDLIFLRDPAFLNLVTLPMHPGAVFCENCGHTHAAPEANNQPAAEVNSQPAAELRVEPKENVVAGFVGAVIGALLGAASIVLIGQLGYISAISGLILAFCTIKGYDLLAKRRGAIGTVICILLIAITPYFADRLNWAIVFRQEVFTDATISEVFAVIPDLVKDFPEVAAEYWKNLSVTYIFALLGAVGIFRSMFGKKK